jgi:hypothetical protein
MKQVESQSIQGARLSLGPPKPSTARECSSSPPLGPRGGGATHSHAYGEGVGGPSSDEGTDTLVL